jgi:hypothetical protein
MNHKWYILTEEEESHSKAAHAVRDTIRTLKRHITPIASTQAKEKLMEPKKKHDRLGGSCGKVLIEVLNISNDAEFLNHTLSDVTSTDIKATTDEKGSEYTANVVTSMKESNYIDNDGDDLSISSEIAALVLEDSSIDDVHAHR